MRLAHEVHLGFGEGRRYRGEMVSIKKDSTPCCQRRRKYVLSAFNDYFILTGEFISGLHYRGLAAPRWPSIRLSFYRGTVKVVRREKEKKTNEKQEGKWVNGGLRIFIPQRWTVFCFTSWLVNTSRDVRTLVISIALLRCSPTARPLSARSKSFLKI